MPANRLKSIRSISRMDRRNSGLRKLFVSIPILCCLVLSVGAQKAVTTPAPNPPPLRTPTPTPERPREIVALLNDARIAAPELGVDTFLKVLESKKITDPVW